MPSIGDAVLFFPALFHVTAKQIIFEIDCLPQQERAAVVLHVLEIAKEMVRQAAKLKSGGLADSLRDGLITPEELKRGAVELHEWLEKKGWDFATLGAAPKSVTPPPEPEETPG